VVNCSTPAAAIRVDSACRRSGSADGKQSLPLFHIIADRGIEGDDAPRIGREYLYAFSAFGWPRRGCGAMARGECSRGSQRNLLRASTGCQWQAPPKDLPPKSTAHSYFMLWDWDGTLERVHHALYVATREREGREASPTAAIIDRWDVAARGIHGRMR
jgi:transposase